MNSSTARARSPCRSVQAACCCRTRSVSWWSGPCSRVKSSTSSASRRTASAYLRDSPSWMAAWIRAEPGRTVVEHSECRRDERLPDARRRHRMRVRVPVLIEGDDRRGPHITAVHHLEWGPGPQLLGQPVGQAPATRPVRAEPACAGAVARACSTSPPQPLARAQTQHEELGQLHQPANLGPPLVPGQVEPCCTEVGQWRAGPTHCDHRTECAQRSGQLLLPGKTGKERATPQPPTPWASDRPRPRFGRRQSYAGTTPACGHRPTTRKPRHVRHDGRSGRGSAMRPRARSHHRRQRAGGCSRVSSSRERPPSQRANPTTTGCTRSR